MVLMTLLFPFLVMDTKSHVRLQTLYETGVLTDPVKAMIELERMRNEKTPGGFLRMMGVSLGIPLVLLVLAPVILPWIRPSYNFYWGDYVAIFDKRRQRRNVIWTVLVLGLIVSIVAGIVTKKIDF
jgi:hypothetical protein